jgi:hypothetical protein
MELSAVEDSIEPKREGHRVDRVSNSVPLTKLSTVVVGQDCNLDGQQVCSQKAEPMKSSFSDTVIKPLATRATRSL